MVAPCSNVDISVGRAIIHTVVDIVGPELCILGVIQKMLVNMLPRNGCQRNERTPGKLPAVRHGPLRSSLFNPPETSRVGREIVGRSMEATESVCAANIAQMSSSLKGAILILCIESREAKSISIVRQAQKESDAVAALAHQRSSLNSSKSDQSAQECRCKKGNVGR
jgi:hypothetical protein